MRKVFLDDLPRWGKKGMGNEGTIDWSKVTRIKVKFVYNDLQGYIEILKCETIIEGKRKRNLLTVKYNDIIKTIDADKLLQGRIGGVIGRVTKDFKVDLGQIFDDKNRSLIVTDREYRVKANKNDKWYKYTCNKCGWTEGWIVESALLKQNTGCSCCCNKTVVLGFNTVWDKARWMCDLGVSEEDAKTHTPNSHNKITITCPDCRKEKTMLISNMHNRKSIACTCSDKISYPNKFAYSLLYQLTKIYKFDYLEHEYSPEWIKPKRYDNYFVFNGKEYILEMDGGFHFNDNKMNGQTKEESKFIDNEKDRLAKDNGCEVIRIDCYKSDMEYIKQNIINSKLNGIFNLLQIDWLKCEEYALSNLVKVACDYWNSGIHSTKEISKIMETNQHTINTYLKKGSLLGISSYDAKEESNKTRSKIGKLNGKQLGIFKDNIRLGIFPSCSDLERRSEEIFGVKLLHGAISEVCIGKRPHHKGFTFKYINEIE